MPLIDLSSYTTLNKYEVLANTITVDNGTLRVVNNSSQSGVANWGSADGSITGTITGSTAGYGTAGERVDNPNATTAKTELTNLRTAISNAGTLTGTIDATGLILTGPTAGTRNYLANTRYTGPVGDNIAYINIPLDFNGGINDQIYIICSAGISLNNVTINLSGGIGGTNVFFMSTTFFEVDSANGEPGANIKGNLIAGGDLYMYSNNSTIEGRTYAQRGIFVFLTGGTSAANYSLQNNSPICFNKGTKILCVDDSGEEVYRLIEDLNIGDLVKTYGHGNLPIEYIQHGSMINNPDIWNECMYRLPSTNPEFEDLIVTGAHGILKEYLSDEEIDADYKWFANHTRQSRIDGIFLQRAAFCKEFIQEVNNDEYIYYHLSLKGEEGRRYGIWGNGVLTESTFKREMLRAFGVSDA